MNLSRKNHPDFYPTCRPSDGRYSSFSEYMDNYPHRNYRNNKKVIGRYDNSPLSVSGDSYFDGSGHTLMQTVNALTTDHEFLSEMRCRYPVSLLRNWFTWNSLEAMRWNYRNPMNRFDKAKYPSSYFLSDRRKGYDELDMYRQNLVYTGTDKRQLANTGLPRNSASNTILEGSNASQRPNYFDYKQYFSEETNCDRFENFYNEGHHSYSVCNDNTGSLRSRNKTEDVVKRGEEGKDFMDVKRKRKLVLDSCDVIDLTCDSSDFADNKRVKMLDTSDLTDNKLVKNLAQKTNRNVEEVNQSVDTLDKTDSNNETKYYAPYEDYDTGFEEVYEDSLLAKHRRYYQNITKQHKTCNKNGDKYKQSDNHFKLESMTLALPAHINYCNDDIGPIYTDVDDEDDCGDEETPFIANPEFGGGNTDEQCVAIDYSVKSKAQKCCDTCCKEDKVDPSINSGRANVGPRDCPTYENSESQERITASAPDMKLDDSDRKMSYTVNKSLSDISSNNINKSLIEFVLCQNNLGSGKSRSSLVNSLANFGCCLLLSQSKGIVSGNRNQEWSRNCSEIESNGCLTRSCSEIKDDNSKFVVQKAVMNTFNAELGKTTRKEKKTLGEVFDSMITDMVNEDTC